MTRYEYGFLTKCAEYGIDGRFLLKSALITPSERALDELGPGGTLYLDEANEAAAKAHAKSVLKGVQAAQAEGAKNPYKWNPGDTLNYEPELGSTADNTTSSKASVSDSVRSGDNGLEIVPAAQPKNNPPPSNTPNSLPDVYKLNGRNMSLGAGAGAAAGALGMLVYELLRRRRGKDDKREYLKKAIIGALGGGALGLGVTALSPKARAFLSTNAPAVSAKVRTRV